MADTQEQYKKSEIGERRNARRAKFVDVVGQYFDGELQKRNLDQKQRLEQIKKKIGNLREKNLSELLGKLTINESQKLASGDSIQEIESKLSEIAQDIEKITSASELNVAEREIKKIEALIRRLEKGITDENRPNILERINGLKRNKIVYMISELYKVDTKLVDDTNIRGKQLFLLNKINGLLKGPPSKTIDQLLQEGNTLKILEDEISNFLEKYYNARKEKSNLDELTPEKLAKIAEQKRQLQIEKERYRRSAQLHALFEKIQNVDENQTYSALDLQRFVKQLREHYNDITTSDDAHLDNMRKKFDLTKIDELINTLQDTLNSLKNDLREETSIPQRNAKLKAGYIEVKKIITATPDAKPPQEPIAGKKQEIETIHDLIIETDYEAQIDIRIETSLEVEGTREFIRGFEEFSEAHMREYEQMRKVEREGTPQQKETMAKAFIKSRIMDEFADIEKVRLLYGTSYRRMWEKMSFQKENDYKDFKSKIITELDEMFGLEDGEAQSTEDRELKTKLTRYLDKYIQTQMNSEQVVEKFENSDPDRTNILIALKADIANAKAKADGIVQPDLTIETAVNTLLETNNPNQPAFEIVSTPYGLALVLAPDKINQLKNFLFGNTDFNGQESIAFTLKECPQFQAYISQQNMDWNGSIMVISSDSDEYTMIHETQHAIARAMTKDMDADQPIQNNIRFNEAVEEIAVRFSSGEIWRELAYPQDERTTNINLSLTGLAYIRPNTQIDQTDTVALYNFVEVAKVIINQDIENTKSGKLNPQDQNIYGEVISEILLGNINEQGKYDLEAATTELKTRFAEIIAGKKFSEKQTLEDNDFSGGTNLENSEIAAFDWVDNNKGFIFDMVGIKDIRGRPNVANDYYMDKKIGIEKAGKEVSTFGSILRDIPIVGAPLGEAYARKNKTNAGSVEYENNDTWIPFLFRRNYKTRNRAFGGVWRKFSHIPFIGDSNEKMTKFGTSPKKMLNDLPPFGRGWEMLLQDFFASKYGKGIDTWIKKTFPGRDMDPIETTKMNATEIWTTMTSQDFLVKDLGEGGLGLKHDQIKRVLANHPMMSIEYTGAQANFEYSRANLDAIDEITGRHKGALTLELVAKLEDDKIDSPGSQFKPKDGTKYSYKDQNGNEIEGKGVKWEAIELGEAMARAYDKKDYSYTINDLINAAHLCHDLGVSGSDPKLVRNDYYAKQPGYDKEKFEQQGDKMVSEFMWYSLENPDIRGVNIQGELFSLDAAHELLRRYHFHHINEALSMDIPEMTVEMQALNAYDIIYTPHDDNNKIKDGTGNVITLDSKDVKRWSMEFAHHGEFFVTPQIPGQPNPASANNLKDIINLKFGLHLTEEVGIALDEHGDGYNIYKAKNIDISGVKKPIKNPFFNPNIGINPIYGNSIAGLSGNEKLSKRFLTKNMAELDGYIEAVEDGLKFSNEYVRRLAEISQYERMSYFRKTFWGDFKLWIQRLGNVAMLGSLIGAGLTGAPIFASLILGTMALRIPAVIWMSKIESTYANRRVNALQLLDEFTGKMGMYKEIMGKPVSRLDKIMLNQAQSSNEAKMEDLAKAGTPEGTFPSGDLGFKFANVVFGEKGLIGRMAGG